MIIPADYGQLNIVFEGEAQPTGAEITFGLQPVSPVTTPIEAAMLAAAEWLGSGIMSLLTEKTKVTAFRVKFGPNVTGPSAEYGVAYVGSVASPTVPPNTAVLCTKLTAAGGRAGRGRFYLPGIQENAVAEDGTITSTFAGDIQAALETFRAGMDTGDCALVLLHGADSPITTPLSINDIAVSTKVATQRRRLRR